MNKFKIVRLLSSFVNKKRMFYNLSSRLPWQAVHTSAHRGVCRHVRGPAECAERLPPPRGERPLESRQGAEGAEVCRRAVCAARQRTPPRGEDGHGERHGTSCKMEGNITEKLSAKNEIEEIQLCTFLIKRYLKKETIIISLFKKVVMIKKKHTIKIKAIPIKRVVLFFATKA